MDSPQSRSEEYKVPDKSGPKAVPLVEIARSVSIEKGDPHQQEPKDYPLTRVKPLNVQIPLKEGKMDNLFKN